MTDYHSIKERAKEMGIPPEEALERRKHFLQVEIQHWTNIIQEAMKPKSCALPLEIKLNKKYIDDAIKELKRLEWECIKLSPTWVEDRGEINKETISLAKAYPIAELLPYPVTHNMTRCPFHEDQHPSATAKGNFLWCFVCNRGWDTISLVMELKGKTFKEAVLDLNGA